MYRFSFVNDSEMMWFIFVIVPIFVLGFIISLKFKMVHRKYSKIESARGLSGCIVARNILDSYGLNSVRVECERRGFGDCYDPTDGVVYLSYETYSGTSISSIGVAAHEVGHAVQHAKRYFPVKFRTMLVPVVNLGSKMWGIIFFVGIIFSRFNLIYLGLALFGLVVFFELVTLPVEFDASFRALKVIKSRKYLNSEEIIGAKKVLFAAAMTYVISALTSIAQLIRFILISRRDDE